MSKKVDEKSVTAINTKPPKKLGKNKEFRDIPTINNDAEMDNFISQYTIISLQGDVSMDDSVIVKVDDSFFRPKKTARLDKTVTPDKQPI